MELRKGYKLTEVGMIPVDWNFSELKNYTSKITVGFVGSMAHLFVSEGVPLLRGQNILPNTLELNNLKFISPETHRRWNKSALKSGDVVLVRVGYPGTACVIPEGVGNLNAASLVVVSPSKGKLNAEFLCYMLNSSWGKKQIEAQLVGGAQQVFNTKTAANFIIPLPSISEQNAIATALSDMDALINALIILIAKKCDIRSAITKELLTGKKRLPGFNCKDGFKQAEIGEIPANWRIEKIKNLALISTGGKNTQDRVDGGRYPFFVRSQKVERINTYSFDGEAVLTAGDGVGTGKVFHYMNSKFDIHQRVYKITHFKPELDGFYFYKYFSNNFYDRIMSMTAKSSVDSVRMEMIADMLIPIPSPEEQREISKVLSDTDSEITALELRLKKTKSIKRGMMQELLTGRTRLI